MSPELEAVVRLADSITIAGVFAWWVVTLRADVKSEKNRVDNLLERIVQLKKDEDMADTQPIPDMSKDTTDSNTR
jgi:hypothetical protein